MSYALAWQIFMAAMLTVVAVFSVLTWAAKRTEITEVRELLRIAKGWQRIAAETARDANRLIDAVPHATQQAVKEALGTQPGSGVLSRSGEMRTVPAPAPLSPLSPE